jgi:hypothetical protein
MAHRRLCGNHCHSCTNSSKQYLKLGSPLPPLTPIKKLALLESWIGINTFIEPLSKSYIRYILPPTIHIM